MDQKAQSKILIIGIKGLLGTALDQELRKAHPVVGYSEDHLDITRPAQVQEKFSDVGPDLVILNAAYTDVDGCEEDPKLAFKVNVDGVRHVAEAASSKNVPVIFMSTDYVFDGEAQKPYTEHDAPRPISVYGRTKFEGEQIIRATVKKPLIVRSSWLFGQGRSGFVQFVVNAIGKKKALEIVSDKIGSPTYVDDLAQAIGHLVNLIKAGIHDFKNDPVVHVTNSGACSWHDMAKLILERKGCRDIELKKIALSQYPFKAKRPLYSALDCSRYTHITQKVMRPWQDALGEFVTC